MGRNILSMMLIVTLWTATASADPKTAEVRKGCKRTKAAFYLASVRSGIQFKPNAAELRSKVDQVDTDKFCDCVFDGFEKTFGVEATANRLQFDQPMGTSEELLKKNQQEQEIYLMCFGRQIGQLNLKPAGGQQIMKALTAPGPKETPQKAKQTTKRKLKTLGATIVLYRDKHKQDPADLKALLNDKSLYLTPDNLKDGWGNDIIWQPTGSASFLRSNGPDGKFGTPDDILE